MATSAKSLSPSLSNPAIARCAKASERAYKLVSDSYAASGEPLDKSFAWQQAGIAFRDALPPLCGEVNIRDFIACVAYALIKEILMPGDCADYFNAAKIALAAARAERRPPKSRAA